MNSASTGSAASALSVTISGRATPRSTQVLRHHLAGAGAEADGRGERKRVMVMAESRWSRIRARDAHQRSSIASFGHCTALTFFAIAQVSVRRYSGISGSSSPTRRSTVATIARRRVQVGLDADGVDQRVELGVAVAAGVEGAEPAACRSVRKQRVQRRPRRRASASSRIRRSWPSPWVSLGKNWLVGCERSVVRMPTCVSIAGGGLADVLAPGDVDAVERDRRSRSGSRPRRAAPSRQRRVVRQPLVELGRRAVDAASTGRRRSACAWPRSTFVDDQRHVDRVVDGACARGGP